MKKLLLFFALFFIGHLHAQTPAFPDFINYQAVLRDANGIVLPSGTNAQLTFRIFDDISATGASYEENHNVVTNTAGLVNVKIGSGTQVGSGTFAGVNWQGGKACYEVLLNGNTIGGRQAFATVPYAIYAKNAGGSLTNGTANQTLYWDGGLNKWNPTSNLNNNGTNVGLGVAANASGNRLHVFSNNPADSSVIFSVKNSSVGRGAAIRAYGLGLTNANTPMMSQAIYGLDSYGGNGGTGPGIGVSGYGSSSGYAYGVVGIGSTSSPTAYAIGLYGGIANGAGNPNSYAAYLNGKTYIGDTLIYFPSNPYAGKVLTMQAGGFAAWRSLASIPSASIAMSQGGIVNVNPIGNGSSFTVSAQAPIFSSIGIGTIVPGAYPNYALSVPTPSMSFNPLQGNFLYQQGLFTSTLNLSPNLNLTGNTLSVAGNSVLLPGLNIWTKPTATAVELFNLNDYVGIGVNSPTEKLQVQSGANTDISIVATPLNNSSLNFGSTFNHFLGKINYSTNTNAMNFSTNGVSNRLVISGNGNVGIGNGSPPELLTVAGNVQIPASNEYFYAGPKTNFLSIPSAAFTSENADTYDKKFISGHLYTASTGGTINLALGTASYFEAPVNLPQGATVTAMDAYVVDNDATYNISLVQLWRSNSPTGSPFGTTSVMGLVGPTSGANANIQQLNVNTITNPVIDNQNFYYYVRYGGSYTGVGAPGQNIRLARILITYVVNKVD